MEISLVSSPMPQSNNWIFFSPPENTGDTQIFLTQKCHKAEIRIKNFGPGTFYFPFSNLTPDPTPHHLVHRRR